MEEKDFEKFFKKNKDLIFRYNAYRKVWTPYELEKKFSDESIYEDGGYYSYGKINNYYILPNKDILLEFECYIEGDDGFTFESLDHFEYRRLSEIHLTRFNIDNEQ